MHSDFIFISLHSCSLLPPSSVCHSVLGRGSEYASPPLIPPEVAVITDTDLDHGFLVLMILAQETQSPPACPELFLHIFCLIARPPCNETTDLLLPLCPQTCNAFEKLFFTGICDNFLASIISLLESNSWYNRYLTVNNCSDLAPSIYNAPLEGCESSSSCTNLFNPETEGIILLCCVYAATQM